MRMQSISFLLLSSLSLVFSEDFGKQGRGYPIEEVDPRLEILEKKDSELLLSEQTKQAVNKYMENPPPVRGLQKTTIEKTWEFDPTIELEEDILDANGKVLFLKGQKVNPLDYKDIDESLFFFDGKDKSQIDLARQHSDSIWVLVDGSPKKLEAQENRKVFFDQMGRLSDYFGLQYIPAKVSQREKKIVVEEILTP